MKKIFATIKQSLNGIYLVDKILLVYMAILLVYISIHLINGTTLQESTTVDTIIRTSSSAIFGYFISNNFIKSNPNTKSQYVSIPDAETFPVGENSVSQTEIPSQGDVSKKNTATDSIVCCSRLQIIVVSGIGFIALVLLLISKRFTQVTPEFSATVSQLRDFLSASIGFLVSCGKSK